MDSAQFDSYTWNLTPFQEAFFNGKYTSYENSNYLNEKSVAILKDEYIKGNTALFHELSRMITESDTNLTTYVSSEDDSIYCTVTLNTNAHGKNVILVHDFQTCTTTTCDSDNYFLNLKDIVNWIVNNEDLPIYAVRKIYTSEKLIYSV
jgi:hypothetical protein